MAPGAKWTLPAAQAGTNRTLYFFRGSGLGVGVQSVPPNSGIELRGDVAVALENGPDESELLLLQGRPINEPVVQYGPVRDEHPRRDPADHRGLPAHAVWRWPWRSEEPVHPARAGAVCLRSTQDGATDKPA